MQLAVLMALRNHEKKDLQISMDRRESGGLMQGVVSNCLEHRMLRFRMVSNRCRLKAFKFDSGAGTLPVQFVGHYLLLDGEGCGQASGFTHGDGVSSDSIAGMGDEISADASSCHQQPVNISRHQCRVGNVVGLHTICPEIAIDFFVAGIV